MGFDHAAAPDWGRLFDDLTGTGLLIMAPVEVAARHLRGAPVVLLAPGVPGSAGVRQARRAARWCGILAEHSVTAISPLALGEAMLTADVSDGLARIGDRMFWASWTLPLLNRCGAVVIPPIRGWREAREVYGVASWAVRHGITLAVIDGGDANLQAGGASQ